MRMSLTTFSRAALLPLPLTFNPIVSVAARTSTTYQSYYQLQQSPNPRSLLYLQCPSFQHPYSAMSSGATNNNSQQTNTFTPQDQQQEQPQGQYLSLPDSSGASTSQIDLSSGGSNVKLDHLGPMVVNTDGTLSRISNWEQMTEGERTTTLRVLGKRNKQRLEALKAAEGGQS